MAATISVAEARLDDPTHQWVWVAGNDKNASLGVPFGLDFGAKIQWLSPDYVRYYKDLGSLVNPPGWRIVVAPLPKDITYTPNAVWQVLWRQELGPKYAVPLPPPKNMADTNAVNIAGAPAYINTFAQLLNGKLEGLGVQVTGVNQAATDAALKATATKDVVVASAAANAAKGSSSASSSNSTVLIVVALAVAFFLFRK